MSSSLLLASLSLNSEGRWNDVKSSLQRTSYVRKGKIIKIQCEKPSSSSHSLPLTQRRGLSPHPRISLHLLLVLSEQIVSNTILPLHGCASRSYPEHFPGLT